MGPHSLVIHSLVPMAPNQELRSVDPQKQALLGWTPIEDWAASPGYHSTGQGEGEEQEGEGQEQERAVAARRPLPTRHCPLPSSTYSPVGPRANCWTPSPDSTPHSLQTPGLGPPLARCLCILRFHPLLLLSSPLAPIQSLWTKQCLVG